MPVSVTKQIELHKSRVYFSKITFILEKILDKLICIGNMLKYIFIALAATQLEDVFTFTSSPS